MPWERILVYDIYVQVTEFYFLGEHFEKAYLAGISISYFPFTPTFRPEMW